MRLYVPLLIFFGTAGLVQGQAPLKKDDGKHLFILSGQSNMSGLKPEVSFTPKVNAAFGENNVIVIKFAAFGQPIRMWYKNWKPEEGRPIIAPGGRKDKYPIGGVYERMIKAVKQKIEGQKIRTVNFLWMQGEGDTAKCMQIVLKD